MSTTRRRFLGSLTAAISAPALVRGAGPTKRLPIAFSTLGCPAWGWKTILERAVQWGYAAIELRGLQAELDLTKCPEFSLSQLPATLKDLEASDLKISDLGSSAKLHEAEPAARAKQMDEARRFIDLAHRLNAPFVRVFGDQVLPSQPKSASVGRVIEGLRELGQHAKGSGVSVLLESHGDFCDSPTLGTILQGAELPTVGLLWDAHHTVVAAKEPPAFTLGRLGRYVRHVHLKDSTPQGGEVRYVLTGTGTVPVRETVRLLVERQYRGYYCFEWEKRWHPEIEEPEVAFPHFARALQVDLLEAGFKPV